MFDKQQFCASHASEKRLYILKNLHTLCAISYHGYMHVRNECSACEKICHDTLFTTELHHSKDFLSFNGILFRRKNNLYLMIVLPRIIVYPIMFQWL